MIRGVTSAIATLVPALAAAAPITPPAGWTLDPAIAMPPQSARFAGATTKIAVSAYRAPSPGAVLYVNRAEAEVDAAARDRIATIEVDELRNALRRQGANAKAAQDIRRFDPATKQLESIVTWRDETAGVADSSRLVVAADGKHMVTVTAQCVLAIDAPSELVQACEAALSTLDTELPPADRVVLALVDSEPPPKPAPDVLDDGGRVALPPITVDPGKPEVDRRPVYVGGGLVVLAALFYWNRKRREKFEREHPTTETDSNSAPPPTKSPSTDDDADDLHAAAGDDEARK